MHLFTALLPPGVLEYCIESPEKIALELNNFLILPYKKNHPTEHYLLWLSILYRLGVAVYAKAVIPRTILNSTTSYTLNLCILPTLETDSFEKFSNRKKRSEVNEQVR